MILGYFGFRGGGDYGIMIEREGASGYTKKLPASTSFII